MNKEIRLFETYDNIKSILEKENIQVSDYQLIDYGIQFSISTNIWSWIIRIYQNKKGIIKIDYSQIKNEKNALKIKTIIEVIKKPTLDFSANFLKNKILDFELGFPIIGTDESGKGDYFGPLVSAGAYVDERSAKSLIAKGIMDSKKLSDNRNIELAKEVKKYCMGRIAVIEISPEKYNDLYDQFIREKKNLNTLLAWGHAKAIEEILLKVDCKIAIADKFADERFIQGKLQEKGKQLKLIQKPKAEQNIAVAAASILARARYLEKLSILSEEFKINLPKGASQKVSEFAKKIYDLYGMDTLRKVAKLHFKITAKIINQ